MDLALDNLQRLIFNKTQTTNQPTKSPMIKFQTLFFFFSSPAELQPFEK